jgi:hypothetical protein
MKLNLFSVLCLVALAPSLALAKIDKVAEVSAAADVTAVQNKKVAVHRPARVAVR